MFEPKSKKNYVFMCCENAKKNRPKLKKKRNLNMRTFEKNGLVLNLIIFLMLDDLVDDLVGLSHLLRGDVEDFGKVLHLLRVGGPGSFGWWRVRSMAIFPFRLLSVI